MKTANLCPICKSNDAASTSNSEILRCNVCSHAWRINVPDAEKTIEKLYKSETYWARDRNHQGITRIEYSDEWKNWVNSRIRLLESYELLPIEKSNDFSIFEFGCSEGMLLYILKQRGFYVLGNEVNPIAQEAQETQETQETLGITILTDPIEKLKIEKRFNLIMSFHVLEHLVDPDFVLEKICKFAKPDGKILLHIPIEDKLIDHVGHDHYHFFSPESLRYLMGKYTDVINDHISTYTSSNGSVNAVMTILGQVRLTNNVDLNNGGSQ